MATELSVPVVRASITHQAIVSLHFSVPHKRVGNDMVFDKDSIKVVYEIHDYNADGSLINRRSETVVFADWTAGFKSDMKDIYDLVTTDAKNKGHIGAGTDEDITAP